MKNQIIGYVYVICFFYLSGLHAAEPEPPENISINNYPAVVAYLNQYIPYLLDDEDLTGLNIVIVNEQNLIWEKGFGYADVTNKVPASPETRYQVGAVTGLLTAVLVMQLVEEGKIRLDQNIKTYLPELDIHSRFKKSQPITVRNLLTHHAGLPLNQFKQSWSENPPSMHSLLASEIRLHASYPPELIYAYSNIGYSLLGIIIERVTGMSFSEAMQKWVFKPVGMSHSNVDNNIEKLATGYKDEEPGKRLLPRDIPAVGMITTAKDLSRFVRQYFKAKPTLAGLPETIHIQNLDVKLDIEKQVGFNWYVNGLKIKNAGSVVWRGGATPYYRSMVAMLADYKLAVVVLSNDSHSWEAINKITERTLQLMLQAKTGIKQPQLVEDKSEEIINSSPHLRLDSFASAYTGFAGYIDIEKEGDEYLADVLGWSIRLYQDGSNKGWFNLEYDLLGFIPIDLSWLAGVKVRPAIINQRRVLIVYYKHRQYLFAERFEPSEIHQAWVTLLGEYQVKNTDDFLESMKIKNGELIERDKQLFFVYQFPVWYGLTLTIPLKTLSNHEAIIPGLGTGLNETVSIKEVEGQRFIEYSGYLLEKQNKNTDFLNFDF